MLHSVTQALTTRTEGIGSRAAPGAPVVAICCFFMPKQQYSQSSWFGAFGNTWGLHCGFCTLFATLGARGADSVHYVLYLGPPVWMLYIICNTWGLSGVGSSNYLQHLGPWLRFCTLFAALGACGLYSVYYLQHLGPLVWRLYNICNTSGLCYGF